MSVINRLLIWDSPKKDSGLLIWDIPKRKGGLLNWDRWSTPFIRLVLNKQVFCFPL